MLPSVEDRCLFGLEELVERADLLELTPNRRVLVLGERFSALHQLRPSMRERDTHPDELGERTRAQGAPEVVLALPGHANSGDDSGIDEFTGGGADRATADAEESGDLRRGHLGRIGEEERAEDAAGHSGATGLLPEEPDLVGEGAFVGGRVVPRRRSWSFGLHRLTFAHI